MRKNRRNQRLKQTLVKTINQVFQESFAEMGLDTLQMGIGQEDVQTNNSRQTLQRRNGKICKSRSLRFPQLTEYRKEISQWQAKAVMPQTSDEVSLHVSTTSFAHVVKELSKCIEGCLGDSLSRNQNDISLPQLLIDYKAVQPLRDGKTLISLHKVHLILQDNFSNSWLCKFLNIMLSESINDTVSNSIDV